MAYTTSVEVLDANPVFVRADDVAGAPQKSDIHTVTVSGSDATVEVEAGNSGVYGGAQIVTQTNLRNFSLSRLTGFKITVPTGTAVVTITGN